MSCCLCHYLGMGEEVLLSKHNNSNILDAPIGFSLRESVCEKLQKGKLVSALMFLEKAKKQVSENYGKC